MENRKKCVLAPIADLLASAKWKLPPTLGELAAFLQRELTALRRTAANGDFSVSDDKIRALKDSSMQLQAAAAAGTGLAAQPDSETALYAVEAAARIAIDAVPDSGLKSWLLALAELLHAAAQLCHLRPTPTDNVTSAQAQALCDLILTYADSQGLRLVAAVCDNGGNLLAMRRADEAFIASIDIAVNKAFTSVALKMPTKDLAELAKPGGSLYGIQHTNNGRIVIFGGGVPIKRADRIIGGIGVSGGTAEQDTFMGDFAARAAAIICAAAQTT